MELIFYKVGNRWFVELLEHDFSEGEREMVCGADTMLDILSKGRERITLEVSDEEIEGHDLSIYKIKEDESGGYYMTDMENDSIEDFELWLCNVTLAVFPTFPSEIFIKLK